MFPANAVDIINDDINQSTIDWVEANFSFNVPPEFRYETVVLDATDDSIVTVVFYAPETVLDDGTKVGGIHFFTVQSFYEQWTTYEERRDLATYLINENLKYVFSVQSLNWNMALVYIPDTPDVDSYVITDVAHGVSIENDEDWLATVWANIQPNRPTTSIALIM